jgi:hypothetical protein
LWDWQQKEFLLLTNTYGKRFFKRDNSGTEPLAVKVFRWLAKCELFFALFSLGVGCLHSVEVLHRGVPVDGEAFFAFGVWTGCFLLFHFTMGVAHQRLLKGMRRMPIVWRVCLKSAVAMRAP